MLSMEPAEISSENQDKGDPTNEEEDGEILEDGEIDEEDSNEKDEVNSKSEPMLQQYDTALVTEDVVDDNEDMGASGDDDKKKHHKKSHHRRRRKKHDDRKSEEKKSRHKKRKGEDVSEEGADSPPFKKRKKRKKHMRDKKDRDSTSAEDESQNNFGNRSHSESPPLPSEQNAYSYEAYDTMDSYNNANSYTGSTYDQATSYTGSNNSTALNNYAYTAESYQQEANYSSGSDSYYSDFESHLKQYQSYKQNKDNRNGSLNGNDPSDDDDNYYSVGYDAEQKKKHHRAHDDSRSSRRHRSRNTNSNFYEEKRRPGARRKASDGRSLSSRDDQQTCRYFKEGHCSKGDKCTYSHQFSSRRNKEKTKNNVPCHSYLANGFCSNREKCNFMHEEYPCKYFHTGTQCYEGENCKFSHEPANDETESIIKQFQDTFNSIDDSKEIEALEKVGIKPLQKPPPGMGLLPTPPALGTAKPSRTKSSNKSSIPSLFDINVQPTPELQQKIEANTVASLKMMDDDMGNCDEVPQPIMPMPASMFNPNPTGGGGLLPLPSLSNGLLRPPLIPNFPPPSLLPTPPILMQPPSGSRMAQTLLPPGTTAPWLQRQADVKDFYDNFYANSVSNPANSNSNQKDESEESQEKKSIADVKDQTLTDDVEETDHQEDHEETHDEEMKEKEEDIIRIDDHDIIKDSTVKAPDFLPAKQKALFMRIHQRRSLSSENMAKPAQDSSSEKEASVDNWTYSSDEDEGSSTSQGLNPNTTTSSESVQSIIKLISNKKTDRTTAVDTNLLSKVANVITMTTSATEISHGNRSTYTANSQSSGKGMMSPPRQPHHRRERKSSGSDASPSHHVSRQHPLRRRLSTSELNKEPVTIPLVTKQNTDSIHTSHPDPRMTLSRLFGKTRTEFRASLPPFCKDIMMPGSGKMLGLKITLSSDTFKADSTSGDKRADPRLSLNQNRQRPGDPRLKVKPNDPRLRSRTSSTHKASPPHSTSKPQVKTSIPSKPTALLTKPPSAIIPSLPELNLDLANIQEQKLKSPKHAVSPIPSQIGDPLARLPKLMRGNVRSSNNHMVLSPSSNTSSKETTSPSIAPYDPRYITAGAPTSTALSNSSISYDPRVLSSQMSSVPPLYDPRSSNNDVKKRTIQLPKLTPAPGYSAPKTRDTNGSSIDLPTGEQDDF